MPKKTRSTIPPEVAARVLFSADRTCCVCRVRLRPVQIHHIDDDPTHHSLTNLAVLCFDCHRETQISGGFDRKLDDDQVVLYRDDWIRIVARGRSMEDAAQKAERARDNNDVTLAMNLAEIYREAQAYTELAIHYSILGNVELRDKYIERAISDEPIDEEVIFLRGLQGRQNDVPKEVVQRHLVELEREQNWHNRARALKTMGRHVEAVVDYLKSISQSIDDNRLFSAAYYIKELGESSLAKELFVEALAHARQNGDLWWQVRALQELGWEEQVTELVLSNADVIDSMSTDDAVSRDLKTLIATLRGEETKAAEMIKTSARIESTRNSLLPNPAAHPPSRKSRPQRARRAKPARG